MKRNVVIHLPASQLNRYGPKGFGLYAKIIPEFETMGLNIKVVERPSTTSLDVYSPHSFHLVHHGFLRRHNVLNCGVAYLWRYWYLDQRGVLCDSSLSRAKPDLSRIDPENASQFFELLQRRFATRGISKYPQPELSGSIGQGKIIVLLQGISEPVMRSMHMMETEMLDLVMRYRGDREVLIKTHPKRPDTIASEHALMLARREDRVSMVSANVHDLLKGAHCSVSICSGASFEGLLHRTPAILFGTSDFHLCAITVRNEAEAKAAFAEVGEREFPFEKFLYWFLRRKTFDIQNPNLARRVLHRIEQTGFELTPKVLGRAGVSATSGLPPSPPPGSAPSGPARQHPPRPPKPAR